MKKKIFWIAASMLIILALGVSSLLQHQMTHVVRNLSAKATAVPPHVLPRFPQPHFFGGFSVNTPEQVYSAARLGMTQAQSYAEAATPNNALGLSMLSVNMHQIDSTLWYYLYQYQCHQNTHSYAYNYTDCEKVNPFPTVNDLLAGVSIFLQQARNDSLIDAYWVLDDGTLWDRGGAKLILQQIHRLIQQYTPTRPAICGFGAEFGSPHYDYWLSSLADNFSPQGCDMVGLYIYSATLNPKKSTPPTSRFDWKMSTLLPKMFSSLRKQGWDQSKEPLIGITQAFSGTESDHKSYLIMPSVQNMVAQALGFCQNGAVGVSFYAWDIGREILNLQTPLNNSQLAQGVQQSVAACTKYWRSH